MLTTLTLLTATIPVGGLTAVPADADPSTDPIRRQLAPDEAVAAGGEAGGVTVDTHGDDAGAACVPHPSIEIIGDHGPHGFTWTNPATGEVQHRPGSGVVAGDGSPENPFVIEGWCIAPTPGGIGLSLSNTTAHAIVRGNVVLGDLRHEVSREVRTPVRDQKAGIRLEQAHQVTLAQNMVSGNTRNGVAIVGSEYPTLRGNVITNNGHGVQLLEAPGALVEQNTILRHANGGLQVRSGDVEVRGNELDGSGAHGIRLIDVEDAAVLDNVVVDHRDGIAILGSPLATLRGNALADNEYSITVYASDGVTLDGNAITDSGQAGLVLAWSRGAELRDNDLGRRGLAIVALGLEFFEHEIDASNLVNDQPLRYVRGQVGGTVASPAGQVIVVDSVGVRIEGLDLEGAWTGIQLAHADSIVIAGNTIGGAEMGIETIFSADTLIQGNEITDSRDGMLLDEADEVTIEDNQVRDNSESGIRLVFRSEATIQGNTVTGNGDGISLDDSGGTIQDNLITDNEDDGIDAENIGFTLPPVPTIEGNNIHDNGDHGLETEGGDLPVDASANWWGAANGPGGGTTDACSGTTADGDGDTILTEPGFFEDGEVCFEPWLTAPNPVAGASV